MNTSRLALELDDYDRCLEWLTAQYGGDWGRWPAAPWLWLVGRALDMLEID
jgi:hypothetical protein